jgi:hypothetical protein
MSLIAHEVTDDCRRWHCHTHQVDEVDTDFWTGCYECGHIYLTARELRRAYRAQMLSLPRCDVPRWRVVWNAWTVRTSKIYSCPHCTHDF